MEFSLARFSFGKGAYFKVRANFEKGWEIKFRTIEEILKDS
jgi:hypothetical protein